MRSPRVLAIAGPDLQHADSEAAAVAEIWGGALVPSAEARLGAVVDALADRDVVHIAAHGRHRHQSPLFSTLRLADGPAFAYELPDAGVTASHIVLSACEVGRGTVRDGDETLGLAAVLLSMGVRTVVAAVSRIPDELAAGAMTAYHRLLVTGIDSATALAQATADLPTVARAFTCFGADWRAAT
jgi:CHAT domain-containing protein